jgi:hypothetical protein
MRYPATGGRSDNDSLNGNCETRTTGPEGPETLPNPDERKYWDKYAEGYCDPNAPFMKNMRSVNNKGSTTTCSLVPPECILGDMETMQTVFAWIWCAGGPPNTSYYMWWYPPFMQDDQSEVNRQAPPRQTPAEYLEWYSNLPEEQKKFYQRPRQLEQQDAIDRK